MAVDSSDSGAGRVSTRERILQLLRRHGRRSAPQIGRELELSPVGIRRHLALLAADGLVAWELEKPARGRPTAIYHLTDAGLETFPRHYDEIAEQALSFLGHGDGSALRAFLAWRNERLAAEYSGRFQGATLEERARELAEALSEQGYMAEVEATPDGVRVCQYNCTVEHIAAKHHDVCASETELFERLLGAKVWRETTVVSGGDRCAAHAHQTPARGARPATARSRSPGTEQADPPTAPPAPHSQNVPPSTEHADGNLLRSNA